jgi:FkbM family methyltransferase
MISQMARFANDCYHVLRAPTGSKAAILRDLVIPPSGRRVGFRIACFNRRALGHLYREIFVRQDYYFRTDSKTPYVLDCGANLGVASLYFKWLYPGSRVKAFEPDPNTFRLLRKNVVDNGLDIETYNFALWDEDSEEVNFFVDSRNPGSALMSVQKSRLGGDCIKVSAKRLSAFIDEPVDFLKIDVEGSESRILRDLVETKKIALVRQMVVEYHHRIGQQKSCLAEFLVMLEQAGFEYQVRAAIYPVTSRDVFQDVLISAYQQKGIS